MQSEKTAFQRFVLLWGVVFVVKLVLATWLPLFVDEAFYWQEGRHMAWAYSDLPGLTAWMARLGVAIGGEHELALRLPFLLLAACIPWLVGRIAAREFGATAGWQAASWAVLLPLAGTLGVLAVPDTALVFAALLCMDAAARLFRGITAGATLELAAGLAIGALSHYRFIAVIGVGFVALLCLPQGRRLLRDPRIWIAIAFGVAAWTPLLAWNMANSEAGLRFQLVDRHPWSFHASGTWFVLMQTLLVTPLLMAALVLCARDNLHASRPAPRLFALLGSLLVLGFFVLGFFADTERVSFHWPLPGYVALLPLLPPLLQRWSAGWRRATYVTAGIGLLLVLGYYAAVSIRPVRERTAGERWYPANFAGWDKLADAVRRERARLPRNAWIVADNFKIGAELGFALDNPKIQVLDHPLNRKHGRAPQLQLWGLQSNGRGDWGDTPVLLVIGATEVPFKDLLARYHQLCDWVGPLPAPKVVNVDHGAQRFLLFALPEKLDARAPCTTPAMAWIDAPATGTQVPRQFDVHGWAFKDGVGLSSVEITLDGRHVAQATYSLPSPGTAAYWKISTDPQHPNVGFRAHVDASSFVPGRHWLGLRLHGRDGSNEEWSQQPIELAP